jgi:phosphohistidine phosphatase SixA
VTFGHAPRRTRRAFLALAIFAAARPFAAAADDPAWEALAAGGHVLVVRHMPTEPGVGDPPRFALGDCTTQRNLSPAGREQATAMGRALAARAVVTGPVLSSRWCRCLDTARLAFGRVEPWPPLDSFFDDRAREPAQTAAVRARAAAWRGPGTLVLVTHQVNITALTGAVPAPGEAIVLKPDGQGGFDVAGRLVF